METRIPILPASAPFSAEQRAWLNGFFAGLLGVITSRDCESDPPAVARATSESSTEPAPGDGTTSGESTNEPWHDPAICIDDRLRLADGGSVEDRLMAAMAQLDCGACGYVCRTYAKAIAEGSEASLTRCAPGGRDTARALKRVLATRSSAESHAGSPANASSRNGAAMEVIARAATAPLNESSATRRVTTAPIHRSNGDGRLSPDADAGSKASAARNGRSPLEWSSALFLRSERLNGSRSDKETVLVALDLSDAPLTYETGDALAVQPENCPVEVERLLERMGASGDEPIQGMPLHEFLRRKADLRAIPDRLLDALRDRASGGSRDRISAMISGEDDWALEHDILDLLDEFPHARPPAVEIAEHLDAIRPRLYSIASSPRAQGREVHLTIAVVRYEKNGRAHKGVASTYLAERARSGARVPVHIHPAPHFRLPPDDVPIIMVGPGTGVAPFRAFLHERKARGASGRNWLFFGERRCDTDFLFRDELRTFLDEGILTRLSTAFSRDQAQKVYVQDRLREHKADVWSWLEEGACLYVCGDASRMAVDVERSLVSIAEEMRGWSRERAREWLRELASAGRYAKDVY